MIAAEAECHGQGFMKIEYWNTGVRVRVCKHVHACVIICAMLYSVNAYNLILFSQNS